MERNLLRRDGVPTDGIRDISCEHYTHFTSPIRRYPDLIVHRMIKESEKKRRLKEDAVNKFTDRLIDIAKHSSERERLAMDAEREVVRVTSMYDDFYRRDEKAHRLVGDRLGKTFRLGDKVKVKVDKVDMEKKKIDFKLVG